jgi:hypothetical protein
VTFQVIFFALLFWGAIFTVYFTTQGTTPFEFLFGRYEPPPADLGEWKQSGVCEVPHLTKEERVLLPPGRQNAGYLLRQVRYRDPVVGKIVRIDPEQRVRRRRVDARTSSHSGNSSHDRR